MVDRERENKLADKILYEILGSKEKALEHFRAAGTLIVADTSDRVLLGGYEYRLTERGRKSAWSKVAIYSGWLWGNPAGSKEGDETAWETARRETEEELGIECPVSPEYPPLIMVVYESIEQPVSLEALDIGVCYPVIIKPSLYRPGGAVKKVHWLNRDSLVVLTEDFMDDFFLWGGAWTEMILRRWYRRAEEDLSQFSGMITFSRQAPGRWPSPYEVLKGRGITSSQFSVDGIDDT